MLRIARYFHAKWSVAFFVLFLAIPLFAESWVALGPDGGDARSLAYDPTNPDRILLGTSAGTVFLSKDGGRNWSRFGHLGSGEDYVLDHIVLDPTNPDTIFVSSWNIEDQKSGDVFRSRDGGRTWLALPSIHGKPIRALAMSPSNSNVLVIGALDGVYRSTDSGETWARISHANDAGIKNIESISIDPKDSNIVYAGTWHLAWKTRDGGITWQQIKNGMIDDSDVFSIIVDPKNPSTVFASACSGIYKSENGGEIFHKIQGIPFSARRTRVLKQDPSDPNTVYAGTTQGLWKTTNGGRTWKQTTNSEIVVNDVLVDPKNPLRLLLATDRGGVLASDDGGRSFSPSNHGYTHRYVSTILPDKDNPEMIFVGIVNDRDSGGVFTLQDGQFWQHNSIGLGGRDVFILKQTSKGTLVAGTNRGIFILDGGGRIWLPHNNVRQETPLSAFPKAKPEPHAGSLGEAKVMDIELTPGLWLAATSAGLFTSKDEGRNWKGGAVLDRKDFISVHSRGNLRVAATRSELLVSTDNGANWQVALLPKVLSSIRSVTISTPDADLLLVSRQGAFRSSDTGKTWVPMLNGLPQTDLSSISYDSSSRSLLATSLSTGTIFQSNDGGRTWVPGPDSGFPLIEVKKVGNRLFGATLFDGLIVQP